MLFEYILIQQLHLINNLIIVEVGNVEIIFYEY